MTELNDLVQRIGSVNEKSGFHRYNLQPNDETKLLYMGNKLALVHGEISEAHDEIRNGHGLTETYYPTAPKPGQIVDAAVHYYKPEGFPSEIADAIIRLLDIAYEADIDIEQIINEKVTYNATREKLHGKKF